MKQTLKSLLTGITVPQEYICVDKNRFRNPISVFLRLDTAPELIDVTDHHVFLGYKPVIIALVLPQLADQMKAQQEVTLEFCHDGKCIAALFLRKDRSILLGKVPVHFYQAIRGNHSFISPVNRIINQLREVFRKHAPGNVGLKGNLYDQVRIAYCVPRVISVITLGTENGMNMFPTDLHGIAGQEFYISSLRIGSGATQQVEQMERIVLSDVMASACKEVYALGKNHMRSLAAMAAFTCAGRSENFGTPLPAYATSYRELERISSFDIGIHRIHAYRVVSVHSPGDSTLAHIHAYYAQWRLDRNIPTEMLIR